MSKGEILPTYNRRWFAHRRSSGDERTRTADPLLAKQVLYQLSYVPCGP